MARLDKCVSVCLENKMRNQQGNMTRSAWHAPRLKKIDVRNANMPGKGAIVENTNPGTSS